MALFASAAGPVAASGSKVVLAALLLAAAGYVVLLPWYRSTRDRCRLDREQLAGGRPTRDLVVRPMSSAPRSARVVLAIALAGAGGYLAATSAVLPAVGLAAVAVVPVVSLTAVARRTERDLGRALEHARRTRQQLVAAAGTRREQTASEESDALRRGRAHRSPERRRVLAALLDLESGRDTPVPLWELAREIGEPPESTFATMAALTRGGLVARVGSPDAGWQRSWFETTEDGVRQIMAADMSGPSGPTFNFHDKVNAGSIGNDNTVVVGNVGGDRDLEPLLEQLRAQITAARNAVPEDELPAELDEQLAALHDEKRRSAAVQWVLGWARTLGQVGTPIVALAHQIKDLVS